MLAIILGLLSGIVQPVQTTINGRLKKSVGSAIRATQFSMLVSLTTVVVLLAVTKIGYKLPIKSIAAEPFWIWCTGILGMSVMVLSIMVFAKLGAVQAAILPASGQIIMGLIIDNFGLFKSNVRDLSLLRGIGAILVILGIITLAKARFGDEAQKASNDKLTIPVLIAYQALGLLAGMFSSSQMAINARLQALTGNVLSATFFNCAMCNITGLLIVTVLVLIGREKRLGHVEKKPYWMWTGGVFGVLFILGGIFATRRLGLGQSMTISLIGISIGGILIDQLGLFGASKKPITFLKIMGIIIMIIGAAIIRLITN